MKPRFAHRALTTAGAVLAGAGVALSAYAAHAAEGAVRTNLQSAALFALVHGVALAALSRQTPHRLGTAGLLMLLLGVLLFSGALVAAHVFATPARLAPAGGSLLILGWLLYAADAFRR
jgi:uncharacterized membrane protein YgdD (TMEM256/DUF423 family)